MPGKALFDNVKGILKRVPGVQRLLGLKGKFVNRIKRIDELSGLIKEGRIVVIHPYCRMGADETLLREKMHNLLKEWIDLYGIVRLRKKTSAALDLPAGAVLLFMPQALLDIPATHEEYLRLVRHETRKAIRQAEKQGYEIKEFVWNDHLDEIYAVNTSKEIRAGEPMRGWYRDPVLPRYHSEKELPYLKYYGAFKDGILCAYLHLWVSGDFAFPYHIIGHAQHVKYGIMNGLVSYAVHKYAGNSQVRWLYYGRYQEGSSLDSFKKHAGFQKYAMLIDLEGDPELLKYSRRRVKTIWRV